MTYAAQLARAYPSPATREVQKQAAASSAAYARFSLRPGQLVIVDEASMAATMDLDYITTAAARAGAKVLLVGDWAQLSPVQAGGAFKLLADTRRNAPAAGESRPSAFAGFVIPRGSQAGEGPPRCIAPPIFSAPQKAEYRAIAERPSHAR